MVETRKRARRGVSRSTRRRLTRRDPSLAMLLASVAAERGVPVEMLLARSRCRAELAVARRLAMYLTHVVLGRRIGAVAKLFRRHWSTVNRACYAIEDMREDSGFDHAVTQLEEMVAANQYQPVRRRGVRHVAA